MEHDQASLLRRPSDLDELLAFLRDAVKHHVERPDSKALETALRCVPLKCLAELVAIAECGRQSIGRTVSDVEDLLRFGIAHEPKDHLVRKLLTPDIPELLVLGLDRIADLPKSPAEYGDERSHQHRRRRTQPIVLVDDPPETKP
jgi:hypothetical protein